MNKFSYSPTNIFLDTTHYSNPASETETRTQFSEPLAQVRDYLNRVTNINSNGDVVRLRLTDGKALEYSTDNVNWFEVLGLAYTVVGTVDD